MRGSAGIGRQARLRGVCESVWVQVPSAAPNLDCDSDRIAVLFIPKPSRKTGLGACWTRDPLSISMRKICGSLLNPYSSAETQVILLVSSQPSFQRVCSPWNRSKSGRMRPRVSSVASIFTSAFNRSEHGLECRRLRQSRDRTAVP